MEMHKLLLTKWVNINLLSLLLLATQRVLWGKRRATAGINGDFTVCFVCSQVKTCLNQNWLKGYCRPSIHFQYPLIPKLICLIGSFSKATHRDAHETGEDGVSLSFPEGLLSNKAFRPLQSTLTLLSAAFQLPLNFITAFTAPSFS